MSDKAVLRSVSFDTSFLLKPNPSVDEVVKKLSYDRIQCFMTTTVVSELEQLKIWGRITLKEWKIAFKRMKHADADIIDFKNRLLSDAFGNVCMKSKEKHHGVKSDDIRNDCNILVSTLKNGIDLFLSEDFHFTSKITREVIQDISHAACSEYSQMCDTHLYLVDTRTFLGAYENGKININIVLSRMKSIRKKEKRL